MRIALARLILAFDFELPKDFDAVAFRSGIRNMRTMFIEKGLFVKISRRPGVDIDGIQKAIA